MNKKDRLKQIWILFNERKFQEAELSLKDFLKRNKNDFRAYNLLGWTYDQWALSEKNKNTQFKRQEKAKHYFGLALKRDRGKQEAVRGMATVLMHQGDFSEALKYYKKAHKIKKNFDTHNDLGNIYQRLSKNDLAADFYRKSYSMRKGKEESAIPLYNLIMISRKTSDESAEKKYLQEINKLAKKHALPKILLERLSDLE